MNWQDLMYTFRALETKCCLPKVANPLHQPIKAGTTAEKQEEGHVCLSTHI